MKSLHELKYKHMICKNHGNNRNINYCHAIQGNEKNFTQIQLKV